jgi:phosphopantetheinyl transferase
MINIQAKLLEASASNRTIDAYHKFIQNTQGSPEVQPRISATHKGEAHVYDNGQIEFLVSHAGLLVLNICSKELGQNHSYIIEEEATDAVFNWNRRAE